MILHLDFYCLCFHIFRSICSMECIDHMFYVVLIVCIICIHMITLGSPCKRHEVLARVGMTRIAKQEVLPRVGMTWIGMQEVLPRVGMTRIGMQEVLPRVGMTWIGMQEVLSRVRRTWIDKQEVMARVGRTWIVMQGRLSRGKCALDRELAYILVGPGVWLDIESDRAGYMGCVCTLEEFLIFQRCWFWYEFQYVVVYIIEGFCIFQ